MNPTPQKRELSQKVWLNYYFCMHMLIFQRRRRVTYVVARVQQKRKTVCAYAQFDQRICFLFSGQ